MEILNEDIFEKKYQKLGLQMVTAKKMDNDTKSFAASLLKTDENNDELTMYNWTVIDEPSKPFHPMCNYFQDSDAEADWDNRCQSLFPDNDIDDDLSNTNSIRDRDDMSINCNNMNNKDQRNTSVNLSSLNVEQAEIISIYHDYLCQENIDKNL